MALKLRIVHITIDSGDYDPSSVGNDLPTGSLFLGEDGTLYTKTGASSTDWTAVGSGGGVSNGDKGDITVTGGGATWTIDAAAVSYSKIQNVHANSVVGRNSGSAGAPGSITYEALLAALDTFTATTKGVVPASTTADGTKVLIDNATWVLPATLGDGWTYVYLTGTQTATDTNPINTNLLFTPSANTTYMVEGLFLLRSDTAGSGPQHGVTWPTGLSDGAVDLSGPAGTTTGIYALLRLPAGTNGAVATAGVPNTTESWLGALKGTFSAGASPAGNFTITLQSESTADAHIRAGSWLRYRTLP